MKDNDSFQIFGYFLLRSLVYCHQTRGGAPFIKSTAAMNVSRTQGSCRAAVFLKRSVYKAKGSFIFKSSGDRRPSNLKSASIRGPMFGISVNFFTEAAVRAFISIYYTRIPNVTATFIKTKAAPLDQECQAAADSRICIEWKYHHLCSCFRIFEDLVH